MLSKILNAIDGAKTYIGMVGLGVLGLLYSWGLIGNDAGDWLSTKTGETIATLLSVWTGVSVAHKGNKMIAANAAKK